VGTVPSRVLQALVGLLLVVLVGAAYALILMAATYAGSHLIEAALGLASRPSRRSLLEFLAALALAGVLGAAALAIPAALSGLGGRPGS
jgi:hypothetical protein